MTYFVRVVELGGVTKAAEALRVAQPALGYQIRRLEAELGVELLVRHARGVKPTKAGITLYERAVDILRRVREAEREVVSNHGVETIRLGLTPSLMDLVGKRVMEDFHIDVRGIDLVIVQDVSATLLESLKDEKIDVALAFRIEDEIGFDTTRLADEELFFVTKRTRSNSSDRLTLKRALETGIAIQTERSAIYHSVLETAKREGLVPNVTFTARTSRSILDLVSCGLAAGILPASSIPMVKMKGGLVVQRIVRPRIHRTLYLVRRAEEGRSANDSKVDDFFRAFFKTIRDDTFAPKSSRRS